MNVTFSTSALAALCNSERRLAKRWGNDVGRTVGRRLYELGAANLDNLHRIPRASVTLDEDGEATIDFGAEIIVRGRLTPGEIGEDSIMITSIEVRGGP